MAKKNIINIALILLGIVSIGFFGIRALHAIKKFHGHRPPPPNKVETDVEMIRDWMTVPFISHMYHIPDEMIFEELKLSPQENRDKSLQVLNKEYFPDKDGYVMEIVKTTILAHQSPFELNGPQTLTATPPVTAPSP
jgi:hypothetical protein